LIARSCLPEQYRHPFEPAHQGGTFCVRSLHWIIIVFLFLSTAAIAQEESWAPVQQTDSTPPVVIWPYAHQPVYPAGHFVILPDEHGSEAFEPALAYSLQRALDSVRAVQAVKGVSAAVLIPGQGIWQGASGISSKIPPVNVDPAMLFGIGSNTKAFVSTTILSLADAGLLSLDDPLSRWLPPYPNITGSVTLRQLMNMTSGLFDYLNDSNAQGDSVASNPTRRWSPEELITTFVGPPHGLPGATYSYCNTNYVLLGIVIKNVTGKSVSSQIRERILTPLSLNHTYLEVEEPYVGLVAHPWDSGVDFASIPVTAHFSTLWTAGGVMSTADNMARWLKALYEGDVVSSESRAALLTFVPTSSSAGSGLEWNGYGLGVRRGSYFGKQVLGHAGAVMGYVSITGYLPETGTSAVVLYNSSEGSTTAALTALFDTYLRNVNTKPSRTGVCYAIAGKADSSRVYLADSATGTLTTVGTPHYGEIVGAKVDPRTGKFWGLAKGIGWELVQIDGVTGESYPRVRVSFPSGAPSDFRGLDFSPNGNLYVGSLDGRIYTINTATGLAALAATSRISISALAFDPASGALWAGVRTNPVLRDRIYKIALPSGDTVGVGNTGFNQQLADLAFDPAGNLFALVGNPLSSLKYRLARIDTATGVGRELGSTGLTGMAAIAFSPASTVTPVRAHADNDLPAALQLEQNYPNPFNPATTIAYSVTGVGLQNLASSTREPQAGSCSVKLSVFDLLGREVAVLVNEKKEPGSYVATFNATGLASGVYIYRLVGGGSSQTLKMVLMR
jgi:CubicO group peptidase (beta-lactamase class C family)